MITTQMKKAASVAAPATRVDSGTSKNLNPQTRLAQFLDSFALLLAIAASLTGMGGLFPVSLLLNTAALAALALNGRMNREINTIVALVHWIAARSGAWPDPACVGIRGCKRLGPARRAAQAMATGRDRPRVSDHGRRSDHLPARRAARVHPLASHEGRSQVSGVLLPTARTEEERRAIRDWVEWNRVMCRAQRPYRPSDAWYYGDGVPRNASGQPYEPLEWKGLQA